MKIKIGLYLPFQKLEQYNIETGVILLKAEEGDIVQ